MSDEKAAAKSQLLWIAALGILAIIAVDWAVARSISQSIADELLRREGQVNQEFLDSILAAEAHPEALFSLPSPSPTLTSFAKHVRNLPGIVRANIYSPDGFIRHSTEPNLIGLHFSDNRELAEAFGGRIKASFETIGSQKPEHLALNLLEGENLIEAYVPVLDSGGKVAAVVEFYRKDGRAGAIASSIARGIMVAAGFSSAVLILALLMALRLFRRPSEQHPARAP